MLQSWTPNLHAFVVHFPIVLLMTAAAADLLSATLRRPGWLVPMGASLYLAGAIMAFVAFWSGTLAVDTVFLPGMARPLVGDHRRWALATTTVAGAVALMQMAVFMSGAPWNRPRRLALAVAGLLTALLVYQTAERGARLVYEQGVGVIAAPAPAEDAAQ